jgi:protein TonB
MSDPRDDDNRPPPEGRRRGVHPLIWVLLLLALAALGWWFYNRSVQSGVDTTAPAATVTGPAITSEQEAAAQAERERAAANERRRAERRARQATAPRPADREVEPIARVQPEYPVAASRVQEEGTVLVRVEVDANGRAGDVSVARRSGSRDLDRAALDAVRQWRFRPAMRNGKAVASVAEVPVEFTLDRQ